MDNEKEKDRDIDAKELWSKLWHTSCPEAQILAMACRIYVKLKSPEKKLQCLELMLKACSAEKNDEKAFPVIQWWMWVPQTVMSLLAIAILIVRLLVR